VFQEHAPALYPGPVKSTTTAATATSSTTITRK